jgi:DNA-binding response OmpR family regulator
MPNLPPSHQGPRASTALPVQALRVLIVEDDPQILDGVVRRLEAAGFATSVARDGFEAARLTLENPPQAIVLDIRLPRCDGLRFLDWIHESNFGNSIPVVVLSASLRDRRRALQAGARFFLCKPYDGHRRPGSACRNF